MYPYRRGTWGDQLAGEGVTLIIILTIIVAAIVVAVIIAMAKELFRIFAERGFDGSAVSRTLWYALLTFFGLCTLAGVLVLLVPAAGTVSAYAVAWGFLLFVIAVEGVDRYAARINREERAHLGELDTYLDFHADGFTPAHTSGTHPTCGPAATAR